jgi:hypothetical protein
MKFLLLILLAAQAKAEYRAFELVITDPTSGQERVVISTLDPNQYRRYYPIKPQEKITYRQTWRCRGNTSGYQAVCPKPEKPAK